MFGWIGALFSYESKDTPTNNMSRSKWDKKANTKVYNGKGDYPHSTHNKSGSHYSTGAKMGNRHFETKSNGKPNWSKEINSKGGRKGGKK
jgi:hypothetical protein